MDPSEPSEHAAPIPKSGTMGITKQTTPAAKARPSPASDLSVDDDERSLRPIGEGKSKGQGALPIKEADRVAVSRSDLKARR